MEKWVIYACISMFFAGFTSVIAKLGLNGISAELGLAVRTAFVCMFVLVFAAWAVPVRHIAQINQHNVLWLGASGITTALSWIFYYKALKMGDVATIALIDRGSVLVTMLLAWLILREVITLRTLIGAALIVGGLVVIAKKP
jgi:transporter family protein